MIEKFQIGDLVTLSKEFLEKYDSWKDCGIFIFVITHFADERQTLVHVEHISGNKFPEGYISSPKKIGFYYKSLTKL